MRCKDTTLFSNNKEFFKKKYRNSVMIAILFLCHNVPLAPCDVKHPQKYFSKFGDLNKRLYLCKQFRFILYGL